MSILLQISQLSAGYGESIILRDINFSLAQGQTLALLGRNGTGKTTLIDTIAGVTKQHSGKIELNGIQLSSLETYTRASIGIGWVPQERNIFKSLTVHENLTAVARTSEPNHHKEIWTPERVYKLFPRLNQRRENMGTQLSGGEQQMLAVGRALVLNPSLLLLDEPLEGLAPIIVEELLQAISQITKEEGISAIIVEQHPQAILKISENAIVLDRGTIAHQSRAEDLLKQPEVLERFLGISK
jgi:branched-chain amino acid transport system ATP-binding protein